MNYLGSKLSLLKFLEESINKIAGDKSNRVFCDLFAGTGIVGSYFNVMGLPVQKVYSELKKFVNTHPKN